MNNFGKARPHRWLKNSGFVSGHGFSPCREEWKTFQSASDREATSQLAEKPEDLHDREGTTSVVPPKGPMMRASAPKVSAYTEARRPSHQT